MARSKFRLFHLILEICKSSFLHLFHLAHVGTYTFRKSWRGFQETCGNVPGFLIWDSWYIHGAFTFMPVGHCLGLFFGGWGTRVGCWVLFQCVIRSYDELGIFSSTASPQFDGTNQEIWVSLLVRSSFCSLFWSGGSGSLCARFTLPVLFWLHTTSPNWTLDALITATWHSVNSRALCIVSCRRCSWVAHSCCAFSNRPGTQLFLPGDCDWGRRLFRFPSLWAIVGWAAWTWLGEGIRDRAYKGRIPLFCARKATGGNKQP